MNSQLYNAVQRALSAVDEHGTRGPRLLDDAGRLWSRAQRFLDMNLISQVEQPDALELACYALQLPFKATKSPPVGKLGRTNLRERAEQAAELLVGILADHIDDSLLDRTTRLLHELPQRNPVLDEARLLADCVNLEDFGATGLIVQTALLARAGDGVLQVLDGCVKREQYGYWDARLKDSFHFEPIREIARKRLETTRAICAMLSQELKDDRAL
jgi:hypothetical protein